MPDSPVPEPGPAAPNVPQQSGEPTEAPSNHQQPSTNDPVTKKANGGAAIAAGVLGVLGTLFAANFLFIMILRFQGAGYRPTWTSWVETIIFAVEILTLGSGSVMLFLRKSAGRWLVLTGSMAHLAYGVLGLVVKASRNSLLPPGLPKTEALDLAAASLFMLFVPPVATAILATLPVTGRWLRGQKPTKTRSWRRVR
jgi:hypothetical protein